jgi:hypothetical protein
VDFHEKIHNLEKVGSALEPSDFEANFKKKIAHLKKVLFEVNSQSQKSAFNRWYDWLRGTSKKKDCSFSSF